MDVLGRAVSWEAEEAEEVIVNGGIRGIGKVKCEQKEAN